MLNDPEKAEAIRKKAMSEIKKTRREDIHMMKI
jgi:hypothetical protein